MPNDALRFSDPTHLPGPNGLARDTPVAALPPPAPLGLSVERQLAACRRNGTILSLLSLRLDGLDAVMLRHGAAVESQVRHAAWTRLQSRLRGPDIAVHVGHDEFGAVLAGAAGPVAELIGARVAVALSEPYCIGALEIAMSVRWGCASYPDAGGSGDALARAAAQNRDA
jgi:GGDEF domain-containing protein